MRSTSRPEETPAQVRPSFGTEASPPLGVRLGVILAGILPVLIGAFWLGAWMTGYAVRQGAAGLVAMKTNMALSQILAGSALLLLWTGSAVRVRWWAGVLASAIVLLVGGLTLSEHAIGWDLGIDQLLANEPPGAPATVSPNRIGPPGSMSLTLLGLGLLALALRRRAAMPYLGLAVCAIILVPAVGFISDIDQLHSEELTGIAWPTVVALLSLGIGLVLARFDGGPMALLLRDDLGGALMRRLLPAAIFAPLVLTFLVVQGRRLGLYGYGVAPALLIIAFILVFSAMLWHNAARLSRSSSALEQSERERELILNHTQFLLDLGTRLRGFSDPDEIMSEAIRCLGEHLAVDDCFFVEIDQDAGVGQIDREWRAGDAGSMLGRYEMSRFITPELFAACASGQPGVAADVLSDPRTVPEEFARLAFRAFLAMPCVYHGRWVAALTVGNTTPRNWREDEVALVRETAARVWPLIDRSRAQQSLRESQERLALAASGAGLGMFDWNVATGETFWSEQQERIFGLTTTLSRVYHYRDWAERVHPEDLPRVRAEVRRCMAERAPYGAEYRVVWPDGSVHWTAARGVFQYDAQGKAQRMLGISMDITDRKLAEEDLKQAKTAAEAANVAKSQFLANMSHELRTPMNAIMGMTALVLGENLSPMVRECLETAKESADSLLELLNQILDFSRIEAGKLELDFKEFSLRSTLDKTLKPLSVRAHQKKLKLSYDVAPEVPDRLIGDPLALRQILTNLVGNAIKFTHQGQVAVRVESREPSAECRESRVESGESRVECRAEERRGAAESLALDTRLLTLDFSVSDTGVGIAPEDQETIFSPFTQADASLTRRFGGTGLGLTISANLVRLMGGEMRVESRAGFGSTFHFTARLGVVPESVEERKAASLSRERLRDVPMLIVDEDGGSGHTLQQMLLQWSMKPDVVPNAPMALTKLHEASTAGRMFPVVLIEAMLPGIDGFTLAGWIRDNPGLGGTVILMLTAIDRQAMAKRCEGLGAMYLEKPVSQSALLAAVSQALSPEAAAAAALPSSPYRPG